MFLRAVKCFLVKVRNLIMLCIQFSGICCVVMVRVSRQNDIWPQRPMKLVLIGSYFFQIDVMVSILVVLIVFKVL